MGVYIYVWLCLSLKLWAGKLKEVYKSIDINFVFSRNKKK